MYFISNTNYIMKKKYLNPYRDDYSQEFHPKAKATSAVYHKPRRNYWGNIFDEDTLEGREKDFIDEDGSNSLFDSEDDHDGYYDSDGYD